MFSDNHPIAVTAPPPRRRRRFWLLLISIPLSIFIGWSIWLSNGLQSAIAEADRLDPGWRLEQIEASRATPPAGQNASDKIAKIQKLKPAGWPDFKTCAILDNLPPSENRLGPEQVAALKVLLDPVVPLLAEARSLIDTPLGRVAISLGPNFAGSLLPMVQGNREVAYFLWLDVIARAEAGDADGAIHSCHAAFHAGSAIGDEPNFLAQWIRVSCQGSAIRLLERTLAQGEPSVDVLGALQARLEMVEAEPLLLYGLRGERAEGYIEFEGWRDGTNPVPATSTATGLAASFGNLLIRIPGFLAGRQSDYLRYMNGLVECARLPPEEWGGRLTGQFANVNQLPSLVRDMVSQQGRLAAACQRNHAQLRCAIVAVAAERYRRAKGQWPHTPEELVTAGMLKGVPTDPHTPGQFIQFERTVDGLIVKSFDASFHLWDVKSRRQPPLPPKP